MSNTSDSEQKLQAQILALQSQVASLSQILGVQPTVAPKSPLWSLVSDYLKTVGGSASPRSIADGLLMNGHKLGKYAFRNIKICLTSPSMKGTFRLTRDATYCETATLLYRNIPYSPKKWVNKKSVATQKN
jgi:hypothetical protein